MLRDKNYVCHLTTVHVRTDVRVFYKECVSLANTGYKVHLIVADGKGHEYKSGVAIQDLGNYPTRFKRIILAPLKLLFAALSKPAAVYHFHDPELLPIGLLLKLFTKAKVIYDAHECYKDDLLYKTYLPKWARVLASHTVSTLESIVARHIDAVITVTDYHAQHFSKLNPITSVVCNYPLKQEWSNLSGKDIAKSPKSICYVGNITSKRGITKLLVAIEGLDCVLHLAGSYEPLNYRNELASMPAWHKVIEYGYVKRDIAIELITTSCVGVMLFMPEPNHINSLSTKVFEYMAGATCVLVSDFPVYNETVQQQNCGVCVDPEDVTAIANALSSLLDNPAKTLLMGKQGRELANSKYNWESQEPKLLDVYTRLLNP